MKPSPRSHFSSARRALPQRSADSRPRSLSAFSMIELMAVMALITLLAGFSVPAMKGITGANVVDAAAAKLSGVLTLARSEAIAQHTIVRFAIAAGPSSGHETNAPRVSLWAWRADAGRFLQLTKWEELPVGTVVERAIPDYIRTAQYANDDAATVRGSCVLDEELAAEAAFSTDSSGVVGRFIEFLPSGSARIPGSSERRAIFVATQGFADTNQGITYTSQANGAPTNWAQVNVDTLTGRTHIYRP